MLKYQLSPVSGNTYFICCCLKPYGPLTLAYRCLLEALLLRRREKPLTSPLNVMPLFSANIFLTPSFIKSIRTINFTDIVGTNVAQGWWGKGIFIIHFWFNNRLELKD